MEPTIRERRRRRAAKVARRRVAVAVVLTALFHLAAVPLALLSFRHTPAPEPEVALVRIPAREWDAALGGERASATPPRPETAPSRKPEPKPPKEKEKVEEPKKPERAPGQVVETAPGNDQRSDDARFAAESDNKVEKETISRDRQIGARVTTPKATAPQIIEGGDRTEEGALVLGDGEDSEEEGRAEERGRTELEIPSIEKRDELALKVSPEKEGTFENRSGSDELKGNSDRLRIRIGDGDGDGEGQVDREAGGGGKTLRLFPSASAIDRIIGAPAPDHVEDVDEGEGTFLNTREWRYASFMNRLKKGVSQTWDPFRATRLRDPTGNVYLWKDRHTVLSVTLRSDGSLADVHVEQSSGVDFLDQEAIAAFERAQPFPNPPRGMMDDRGQIQFHFGFYIETGRAGLRIFRR